MKSFSRIQIHFLDYLDGCLPARTAAQVRHRLRVSAADRDEMFAWQTLDGLSRDAITFRGEAYTFDALRARMAQMTPMEEVRLFLPRLRVAKGVPRYAVAAVMLLLFTAIWLYARPLRDAAESGNEMLLASQDRLEAAYAEYIDGDGGKVG